MCLVLSLLVAITKVPVQRFCSSDGVTVAVSHRNRGARIYYE